MSGIARKDRWSGMYGFGRMSDSKSVVGFVKDIENNPCLYDMKSHDYVNHALKRKTWMNIAKKWNCSVAECKEKWRKIRTAYSRSLKQKYRDNRLTPYRPYYLASYLKFLTPKIAIRRVEESQPQSETNDIRIEITPDEENHTSDESDNKFDTQDENPDEIFEDVDRVNNEDNEFFVVNITSMDSKERHSNEERKEAKVVKFKEVRKVKEVKIRNDRNSERIRERCSYCANIESQPRKMLLFSLLPDIEALSDQQMRTFRRELIDLIDRCKYDVLASV